MDLGCERFALALPNGEMTALRFGRPGPPRLVFLHANGFSAGTYAPLLAPLAESGPIVALDLRGHGRSRLPAEPDSLWSWDAYAEDLDAALDRLLPPGSPPTLLAGHSLGGTTALLGARRRPDRIAGFVLLDPVLLNPWIYRMSRLPVIGASADRNPLAIAAKRRRATFPSRVEARANYAAKGAFKGWDRAFLDAYVEDAFVETPAGVRLACAPAWEAATFAAQRHDAWGAYRAARGNVRVIIAEHGSTVYGGLDRLARLNPAPKTEIAAGTSHFFPFERPDLVRARLAEALSAS